MRFALVQPDGRVAQVEDEPFPVAPPFRWLEAPDEVQPEWRLGGGGFAGPARPSEPEPARDPLAEIDSLAAALVRKGTLTEQELEVTKSKGDDGEVGHP